MDSPRISKRSHRGYGRSNLRAIRDQTSELVKRQGVIGNLLSDFCKAHPNNVLCKLLPPPSKNSNKPKPTPNNPPSPPATTTQTPNTPSPNPPPNTATTPKPTPTTPPVVNTPASTPNANPPPNSMSGTSLSTPGTSSIINTSTIVPPTGVPALSSTGPSDPLHTAANSPADNGATDRGGSSDKTTAGPLVSVPFGTDPSSTVGVGNNNNLPGSTVVGNNASAAAAGANAGPIIGGILGAVFLILVILATLVWLRQKRNRASRVAPSSEFMGTNRQYPFAAGVQAQGQQARLSDTETRSVGNAAISPRTFYDIRRGG